MSMPDNSQNPYSAPVEVSTTPLPTSDPSAEPLAGRFTRFAAALLDGILMMIVIVPAMIVSGYFERVSSAQAGILEQLLMSFLGLAVFLVLNGYLLAKRGQTIGKAATSIQIVEYNSGRLLPFARVYVYRYLWSLPLMILVVFIPSQIDDTLANLVILVDVLMIFGSERRCLHDLIAGSKVVLYNPNREIAAT